MFPKGNERRFSGEDGNIILSEYLTEAAVVHTLTSDKSFEVVQPKKRKKLSCKKCSPRSSSRRFISTAFFILPSFHSFSLFLSFFSRSLSPFQLITFAQQAFSFSSIVLSLLLSLSLSLSLVKWIKLQGSNN